MVAGTQHQHLTTILIEVRCCYDRFFIHKSKQKHDHVVMSKERARVRYAFSEYSFIVVSCKHILSLRQKKNEAMYDFH